MLATDASSPDGGRCTGFGCCSTEAESTTVVRGARACDRVRTIGNGHSKNYRRLNAKPEWLAIVGMGWGVGVSYTQARKFYKPAAACCRNSEWAN